MDETNSKISFIPKESLVREEPFLSRRRPRSAMSILAIILFLSSIGGYGVLYVLNKSLSQKIQITIDGVKRTRLQQTITNEPYIERAKIFIARAALVRELLNSHTVVSPVFDFLVNNTVESIMFSKFSFDIKDDGSGTLKLFGEAPSYATLAFQEDILRKQKKDIESFIVEDITLTDFGTVEFNLSLTFRPEYLRYSTVLSKKEIVDKSSFLGNDNQLATSTSLMATTTFISEGDIDTIFATSSSENTNIESSLASEDSITPVVTQMATTTTTSWRVFLQWFKFW